MNPLEKIVKFQISWKSQVRWFDFIDADDMNSIMIDAS